MPAAGPGLAQVFHPKRRKSTFYRRFTSRAFCRSYSLTENPEKQSLFIFRFIFPFLVNPTIRANMQYLRTGSEDDAPARIFLWYKEEKENVSGLSD